MSTPSSSPLTALRDSLWGFLVFAGAAWLAIGWSVLRLEPTDVVRVAGPVIVFGALTEALWALGGGRMWGLNAGMAVLFAVTGGVLVADTDTTFTTPAALIGWYLMVRGAADVTMAVMARGMDRTWGLLLALGVVQTGLGFFAASSYARSGQTVILLLGGLALARAVADLTAAMSLREAPEVPQTPREHAAGVAGYAAGLADYAAAATARSARPRHRAAAPATRSGDDDAMLEIGDQDSVPEIDEMRADVRAADPVETTANLDAMLALAGVSGAAVGLNLHEEVRNETAMSQWADARELATAGMSPATMFSPVHLTGSEEVSSVQGAAAYRMPAGPPVAMPIYGGAAEAAIAGADTADVTEIESGSSAESLPTMSVGAAALPGPAATTPQNSRSGPFWRSKNPGRRRAL